MAAIAQGELLHDLAATLAAVEPTGALDASELGPPVPRPRNCYAIGLNYRAHVDEASMDVPEVPLVFTKFPSCIVGPDADVELVVVIGVGGRDIAADDAWGHVAGLTGGQDISDRALQFAAKPPHFDMGKSRDTYGPIGPLLVSPDLLTERDDVPIPCEPEGVGAVSGNFLQPGDTITTTLEGIGTLTNTCR